MFLLFTLNTFSTLRVRPWISLSILKADSLKKNLANETLVKMMNNAFYFTLKSAMLSCPRFIWITNSSDHRRVWTENLLHTKYLPKPTSPYGLVGLGKYFVCKKFAVQTLLWSLEFVMQINLGHDNIAVWNLTQSWSISTLKSLFVLKTSKFFFLTFWSCRKTAWLER